MCETVAMAISAAMAVASAAVGYQGQVNQAKAQTQYAEAQTEAIRRATINTYDQLQLQRQQDYGNAQAKIEETRLDAAKARATALVSAGEAGVSGLSVDQLLGDIYRQEQNFTGTVQENVKRRDAQIQTEMESARAGAQSNLNNIRQPVQPSFAEAGLRAGAGIMDAYARFKIPEGKAKATS